MGLYNYSVIPSWDADYSAAASVSAAESDPSLGTDGTAVSGGAGILQIQTHTLSAVTDYELEVWLYVNSKWSRMYLPELTGLGEHPLLASVEIGGYGATRWSVIVSYLNGTSLSKQVRQV